MKYLKTGLLIMLIGFLFTNCNSNVDLLNEEFPEAKQEIINKFGEIAQSLKDGVKDKLL